MEIRNNCPREHLPRGTMSENPSITVNSLISHPLSAMHLILRKQSFNVPSAKLCQ